jgi:hypothetical protein
MSSIAGFVIGNALASQLRDPDDRRRVALVGAFMPTPLLGAIVAQSLVRAEEGDGPGFVERPGPRRAGARGRARDTSEISDEVTRAIALNQLGTAVRNAADANPELKQAVEDVLRIFGPGDTQTTGETRRAALEEALARIAGTAAHAAEFWERYAEDQVKPPEAIDRGQQGDNQPPARGDAGQGNAQAQAEDAVDQVPDAEPKARPRRG